MLGSAWLFTGPQADAQRTNIAVPRGQPVELLAAYGARCQVRWQPRPGSEFSGWLSCRWLDLPKGIPAALMTPLPGG